MSENAQEKHLVLPLARVKRIVKTDPDIKLISSDAAFLITRSTELFIQLLAKEAYKETLKNKRKVLQYNDLSKVVKDKEEMEFLLDIIPQKRTVKE